MSSIFLVYQRNLGCLCSVHELRCIDDQSIRQRIHIRLLVFFSLQFCIYTVLDHIASIFISAHDWFPSNKEYYRWFDMWGWKNECEKPNRTSPLIKYITLLRPDIKETVISICDFLLRFLGLPFSYVLYIAAIIAERVTSAKQCNNNRNITNLNEREL